MNGHLKGEPPRYPTARCIMRDNCGHDLRLRYRSRTVSWNAEKTTKGADDPGRSNRPPSKPIRRHRTESMTAAPSCACCCAHLLWPRARGPPAMRPSSATACRPCCLYTTAFFNAGSQGGHSGLKRSGTNSTTLAIRADAGGRVRSKYGQPAARSNGIGHVKGFSYRSD